VIFAQGYTVAVASGKTICLAVMSSLDRVTVSAFEETKTWLQEPFQAITAAGELARSTLAELRTTRRIEPQAGLPENLGLVAYGSLAREEWTLKSDVDWTLLIDGPAAASHFELAQEIAWQLEQNGFQEPGATGTFGSMASSHELIHRIGGTEDTNQNLTRRILLLLESVSINDSIVRDRVLRQVLERYIACDPSVSWLSTPRWRVPRFLLNDVVRYWRTVAVDYAWKKWEQGSGKWALRNIKLRFSRKLLFAKGLLLCLDCEAGALYPLASGLHDPQVLASQMIQRCFNFASIPAVELLCMAAMKVRDEATARALLRSYESFLELLNDGEARKSLETLPFDQNANLNEHFAHARNLGREFQRGMEGLFFGPTSPWAGLMKSHGVF
jgi:hypothetical protein